MNFSNRLILFADPLTELSDEPFQKPMVFVTSGPQRQVLPPAPPMYPQTPAQVCPRAFSGAPKVHGVRGQRWSFNLKFQGQ